MTEKQTLYFGLSHDQNKIQVSVWAILAAPLLLGNDPRDVNQYDVEIMQNKDIIAIDQDPLGKQGYRIQCDKQIFKKISNVPFSKLFLIFSKLAKPSLC